MPKKVQEERNKGSARTSRAAQGEVEVQQKSTDQTDLKDDLDALLDEIDSVLVENAQEFVDGFIQRGGE